MKSMFPYSVLALALLSPASAGELRSTAADQTGVAVTIYNDDLALVKDERKLALDAGPQSLAWREVSARMRPETALLHGEGLRLLEQNFDFDLLTPNKLLEKYVGRTVQVIRTHPTSGAESREEARVLSAQGGAVLKYADRIETGVSGRLAYPDVPDTLRDAPTLVMSLDNARAGARTLELSYLTGGLSWHADYVAELSPDDGRMDLSGWVTLTNQSGASYSNAKLQLVAGDVHRVREAMPRMQTMARTMIAEAAPDMAQESLFEYHLYTLNRPTTLRDNQTKQVALLSAGDVPVAKTFELMGADYYYSGQSGDLGRKLKVGTYVEFLNKGGGLGIPLPKGVVRVYKKDSAGRAQFVGEDDIDHTPKNETVRLKLGDAFDITADKKQTDFQKLSGSSRYNYQFESAYEIVLKNAKSEPVTVKVREPMPGDWQIVSSSQPHRKASAHEAQWDVTVPAEGETTLTWRVRVRY
jgi:hypothetical protein